MKKSIFVMALAAMSMTAMADETLMTINGKPVSAEEFIYIYEKNNQAGAIDPKSKDEYLDMFINFCTTQQAVFCMYVQTTRAVRTHGEARR